MISNLETKYKIMYLNDKLYHVTYTITKSVDDRYGADADGNRYVSKEFIDEIKIVECLDSELNEVTNETIIDELESML